MQAVAGQRKQKVAAAGFQPLLFGIFGQKPKHMATYAQIAGVPRCNYAEQQRPASSNRARHCAGRERGIGRWGKA